MNKTKMRGLLSLIFNVALIALTVYSVFQFFISTGQGNMQVSGFTCFRYFTILSNVFAALTCAAVLPDAAKSLVRGVDGLSHGAMLLKFMGTVAVTVTLVVVLVFLGPTMGYDMMFTGSSLHLHLICPLLAIVSFCFFERGGAVSKKETMLGDLSVIAYGTVYLIMVVITGIWPDFYGFNRGGMWYVSYPVILLSGYVLSLAVRAAHNAQLKHEKIK